MKIVIVGGGFGGVKTALELANKPGIEVTLIAPTSNFEYHGALYRSATGRSPLEVAIRINEILGHAKNVEFVLDRIVGIDTVRNFVIGADGNMYNYDAVVLAMGNQVNYFGIEGMAEHAATMVTVPGAIDVRARLVGLIKSNARDPKIVIVGAGPTGTELAGDIQTFADMVATKYLLPRKNISVTLVEGAPRVLPTMHEKLSAKVALRLAKLGVKTKLGVKVIGCQHDRLLLDSGEVMADLVLWTAGTKAVDFYSEHTDVFTLERGRVVVDEYMRAKGTQNVYVIGDNAFTPFTGMAQTALHDALFVAHNFIRLMNKQETVKYRSRHPVYVVPVGPRWAVLQNGKTLISGYRAWLARRRADLWIFENFEPYKKAIKQWRRGNRTAKF